MLLDTKLGMNLQKTAQVHDGLLQQHLVFTTGKTLFLVLSEAQRLIQRDTNSHKNMPDQFN